MATRQIPWARVLVEGVVIVATGLLVSCTPAEPASEEADTAAILSVANQWVAAYTAGDIDALMALYTDDAVDIPPGQISVGKEAIRERQERGLVGVKANSSVSFDEIVVSGDWAFARGVYEAVYTDLSDSTETPARNDNLWIFERQTDGTWLIARMMYNPAGDP